MEPITLTIVFSVLKDASIIASSVAALFGVFKVINWIKTKIANIDSNVVELKTSMDTHIIALRNDVKDQTTAITAALSEQRQDFRTFYAPTLLMMQNQQNQFQPVPIRAKKQVKRKSKG